MERYPVVIPYIRTADHGSELKHALRSLKNITNFNGEVYIVGEREIWFNNLHTIEVKREHGRPYFDVIKKLQEAAKIMPEKFIVSMDDVYITKPTEVGVYNKPTFLSNETGDYYKRTKAATAEFLKAMGIENPLDFECHAPMLVEKSMILTTFDLMSSNQRFKNLQWRSIYGNVFEVESLAFNDKKTKTKDLPEGDIISTQFFTDELDKLFPDKSIYELGRTWL